MTPDNLAPVALDPVDAMEIAEACQFLAYWLTAAAPEVAASLDQHVGCPGYHFDLRDDLARFAEALVAAKPVVR